MNKGQHNETRLRECNKQKWTTNGWEVRAALGGVLKRDSGRKREREERINKRMEERKNLMRRKKKGGKEGREIERCV